MPTYALKCEKCGVFERMSTIARREDPCDTCGGPVTQTYVPNNFRTYQDDIPGGLVIENLGKEPVTVYSHSERLALAKSRGLEPMVRHIGTPGSDRAPHTIRWDGPPIGDPRPIAMLPVEERRARRLEAAARLEISLEELDKITGNVEEFGVVTRAEDDETERTGGEFAERAIRNRFNVAGSDEDMQNIMEIIREGR